MDNSMKSYKIILIGDPSVGKTNLLTQYVDEKFTENNISTVGIEFKNKIVELEDGKKFRLQIWDTSGQEKFRAITKNYFRGCDVALFVFDVTNQSSFDNISIWLDLYKEINGENSQSVLIGNKIDLGNREVDGKKAKDFAIKNGLQYFEISVKENKEKEIDNMLVTIVKSLEHSDYCIINVTNSGQENRGSIKLNNNHNNNQGRIACC